MVNQSERGLFDTMISGLESEPGATRTPSDGRLPRKPYGGPW